MTDILKIENLHAEIDGKPVLKGIDLTLPLGETHAIMGPNGSGKSTLANVLAGHEEYQITQGRILYKNKDLSEMEAQERACEGIFLAFQYPVELPGVSGTVFLREAANAKKAYRGEELHDMLAFTRHLREKANSLKIDQSILKRGVNEGFSGGEKKRYEMLQMAILEPELAILDETDSGLDIDALRVVSESVNRLRVDQRSFLVITHYQRLLEYIVPDRVHVLVGGRIVRSGGKSLALELERDGYAGITKEVA